MTRENKEQTNNTNYIFHFDKLSIFLMIIS